MVNTSSNGHSASALSYVGAINFSWANIANLLFPRLETVFGKNCTAQQETIDEFVLRQQLRELIIETLSKAFVTYKEVEYLEGADKKRRIDLVIGGSGTNNTNLMSIELKSDAAKAQDVKDDWEKLRSNPAQRKISVFAGVATAERFKNLQQELTPTPRGVIVIFNDSKSFTSQIIDERTGKNKELVVFALIVHVETQQPNMTFYVYQ